jgi:mannosyltransferase
LPAKTSWRSPHLLTVLVAAGAVVALRWLPPLTSSFWLDETGTVWLLRGSLSESLGRALEYQGGSPLFYVIEWPVRAVLGTSELALRVPSLVASVLAAGLVFVLGRRLFDVGAGAVAAVIYVSLPIVGFSAGDARPYALASMTLVASGVALVRWLETGRSLTAAAYVASFAATVYLHYLFTLALLAHPVYALVRRRRGGPVTARAIAVVYAAVAVALVPAVPTLLRVLGQRGLLSNPFPVTPAEVLGALLPGSLALVLVGGGALAALVWRPNRGSIDLEDGGIVFLLSWFALPFVVLVLVSVASATTVLVPRYFIAVLPAVALLAGALLTWIRAVWPQVAVAVAVAVVSIVRFAPATHTAENWRAAAALERRLVDDEDTPVLLFAGFVEAKQPSWVVDPEKASYLNAPATAYPFDGDVIALPFGVGDDEEPFMEELVRDQLTEADRFVLVTRGIDSARVWLDERLAADGVASEQVASFGGEILVYLFTR